MHNETLVTKGVQKRSVKGSWGFAPIPPSHTHTPFKEDSTWSHESPFLSDGPQAPTLSVSESKLSYTVTGISGGGGRSSESHNSRTPRVEVPQHRFIATDLSGLCLSRSCLLLLLPPSLLIAALPLAPAGFFAE